MHLSAAISARLQYYNKVIDKCKKDFLLGQNSFLNALYSDVLVDKHKFDEIANVYGYPLIEGDNNIIMPGGNHPYKETAYMIGFELIIKRIESTGVNAICGWYKKECSKGEHDNGSKVTYDCKEKQWNKSEKCLMTAAMEHYGLLGKKFLIH